MKTSTTKIREQITQSFVNALNQGLMPWRRGWSEGPDGSRPCNFISKRSYTGINPILLLMACEKFGFNSRYWGTKDQWHKAGCKINPRPAAVHPSDWGTMITYYSVFDPFAKTKQAGKKIAVMRTYRLYNLDQVTPVKDSGEAKTRRLRIGPLEHPDGDFGPAETLIVATGVDIHYGGNTASYNPEGDFCRMPHKGQFVSLVDYYETVFHELVHWTEHPARLAWDREKYGYAYGELVAEIGACFVAMSVGLPVGEDLLVGHHAYVEGWLRGLGSDPKFIFDAARHASRAADYLMAFTKKKAAA